MVDPDVCRCTCPSSENLPWSPQPSTCRQGQQPGQEIICPGLHCSCECHRPVMFSTCHVVASPLLPQSRLLLRIDCQTEMPFLPNRELVDSFRIYTQDQREEHEESGP